jgi:hypothetical protein
VSGISLIPPNPHLVVTCGGGGGGAVCQGETNPVCLVQRLKMCGFIPPINPWHVKNSALSYVTGSTEGAGTNQMAH